MTLSRFAPLLIGALLIASLALWATADADDAATSSLETRVFDQLAGVAAAHGHTIPDGLATYARVGDTTIAHAPLDGIAGYTAADFAAGVLVMAIVIDEPAPGRVPNGAYVVQIKLEPGSRTGVATYFDARGRAVASAPARARTPDASAAGAAGVTPRPASSLGSPPRTQLVWNHDQYAIECAGWQPYQVISY